MKTFLKTLLGGALGIGALYVVGKLCYEAGKDVAEVERQLEKQIASADKPTKMPNTDENNTSGGDPVRTDIDGTEVPKKTPEEEFNDALDTAWDRNIKPTFFGKTVNKIKNLKLFMRARKAFGGGDRKPGVLATLLSNPEGARIEAFVKDGGVQINVQPNAA